MSNYKITINELDSDLRDKIENCEGGKIEIPHNGRVYTDLSDLGLTNDDFSIDDIKSNLHLIVDTMEDFSICLIYAGKTEGHSSNLRASITQKFLNDLNISYTDSKDYSVKITKFDSTRMPSTVEILPNQEYRVFGMTVDRQITTDYISNLSLIYGKGSQQDPIYISSNQDLNNFRTPCFYSIPKTDIAKTVLNIPVAVAGSLEIIKSLNTHSFIQRFTPYENYGQSMYTRTYYKELDRWSEWSRNLTIDPVTGFIRDSSLKIQGGAQSLILKNANPANPNGIVFTDSNNTPIFELEQKAGTALYMYDNTNKTTFMEYNNSIRQLYFKIDTLRITTSDAVSSTNLFRFYSQDANGLGAYTQSGGMYVIGGGEGANTFLSNFQTENSDISGWNHGSENIVLYADDHARIMTNGQTWANRNQWIFAKDGTFRSPKSGFIGGTFFGTSDPASSTGLNGDTYIKY